MWKNILAIMLFISINVSAQHYTPVDSESKIHFVIKNFGINTGGDLKDLKGEIYFNPENLTQSKFNVTVAVSTIDTDNEIRDKSLKSNEYFDASEFPVIRIVSSKISKTNKTLGGYYYFNGNLTIKGVTKPVSFPFQVKKVNNNYLFTGGFELDRTDFGLGEKNMVLSSKVVVSLSVSANKK
ncbi:MAG: YceI family protein [Ginsengibacter sp.]